MTITEIDKAEAYRYMGGRGEPDGEVYRKLCECEKMLLPALTPRYRYEVFDISVTDDGVMLSGGVLLKGKDIISHLDGCERAVVMCVTAGQKADTLIRTLEISDMAAAAMTDCLASAAAEQICEKAEREIFSVVKTKYRTTRFSPGYGDLPLAVQPQLLKLCDAERKIGLHVTDTLLLTPRKSVTAIIGISDKVKSGAADVVSCDNCAARENCMIRKNGGCCGNKKADKQ